MFFTPKIFKKMLFMLLITNLPALTALNSQETWMNSQERLLEHAFAQLDKVNNLLTATTNPDQQAVLTQQKELLLQKIESGMADLKAAKEATEQQSIQAPQHSSISMSLPLEQHLTAEFNALENRVMQSMKQMKHEFNSLKNSLVITGEPTATASSSTTSSSWQVNNNGAISGGEETVIAEKPFNATAVNVVQERRVLQPNGRVNTSQQRYQLPVGQIR